LESHHSQSLHSGSCSTSTSIVFIINPTFWIAHIKVATIHYLQQQQQQLNAATTSAAPATAKPNPQVQNTEE